MNKMRHLWFVALLLCMTNVMAKENNQQMEKIYITDNWQFSQAQKNDWKSASVPGTVHQDLLNHQLLPNPFYGLNENEIQWVENFDWEYKTTFTVTSEQLQKQGAQLFLEGLDTYADVYLNGSLLMKSDNMFVGYKKEVRSILREGDNNLHIYFHSPINYVLPQWASNGFDYPADNDHHEKKLSIFTRKAPYSYGWDWGIRMATSGVWRPISLTFYDLTLLDDIFVNQKEISKDKAVLDVEIELTSLESKENANIELLYGIGTDLEILIQQVDLVKGLNRVVIPIEIENPKLWMPNGWGTPFLYDFSIRVSDGEVAVSEGKVRTGLRTIRLVQEPDAEGGESYYFEVNGEPMFAKGGNYIPDDAMLPNVSTARYETMFQDMREANMNMVRVWGGGTYEDDRFYQLADENGIVVWQDFMFGCTTYPHDPTFKERVEAEAIYNIKRLRNYASLALWCGNNEVEEGIKYWGWDKRYTTAVYDDMKLGYDELFHELLPAIVAKYDGGRSYVHGSPFSANWGRPESWKKGDSHNWGIWYGRKPFESLDTELSRFMSEFGFQSFPEMKTISTFAEPKDYALESDVMNGHQKSSVGNELIEKSMQLYYVVPQKFEDFVYVGLVLQGQGMKRGFEAHRRNKPYCMGTLYWQLNDSWPVVSWSSLDYYGNWKALHYQAKRAFAPLAINTIEENGKLVMYALSDRLDDLEKVTLEYELVDFSGNVLEKNSIKGLEIPSNSSTPLLSDALEAFVTAERKSSTFLNIKLIQNKKVLAENQYYFNFTKDLALPEVKLSVKSKKVKDGVELTLSSKTLVKDLFIECPVQSVRFTDNFFDLLPGEKKVVRITLKDKGVEIQQSKLKFNHIKNTTN